jgi:CDP-4-dehydro-6-deoxyglucose reductase
MCSCTALSSDLVLEVLEAGAPEDIPEQRIVAKVRRIDALNGDVMRLHLQTPRSNRLRFLAGQRVTLGIRAGVRDGSDVHGEFPWRAVPATTAT